jgi:hypothetical protein
MIVNIYGVERGKKRIGGDRRRGLTLTRIILHHHKNFREHVKKGKKWSEQGKIGCRHYSTLAGNAHYKGGMKWRHAILMLVSLYAEWETHPLS